MAPMTRPPRWIGEPPSVGRIWPWRTVGTMDQKPPLATRSASSAVRFLNDAAAIALAREAFTTVSAISSVMSIIAFFPLIGSPRPAGPQPRDGLRLTRL